MKRKDPATKNQKILAVFLAFTMLLSACMVYFSGDSNKNSNDDPSSGNGEDNLIISFSQIPGKQVNHKFNSVADGLKMSPEGVISATYVDLQKTTGTPFEKILGNVKTMDTLYGADVTKRYGAGYADGSGFELHQIPEQKILMPWGTIPHNDYYLLARTNNTHDVWNVVGSPVILGPRQTIVDVIDVLGGNETSTTEYNSLLSQANPEGSIYQEVITKTNFTDIPADQIYTEIKKLDDGSYRQTSLYLNLESEFTERIQTLQANSTERGVTYNVTTSGDITKLTITSDFGSLLNETQLLSE
ncbi:MAG: hypothetical protein PHH67_09120 [Methanosarcina sp.]|jgi:hypothetical protein|nr:hypothetical protein [Methanosarcina sp.]MDD3316108.1 hypothetical protein [Methanosarcina sp.]MDD4306645.1 hypothetical protein [Methanosarcina sp.]MDD4619458.1 hypothetical protein [Methanosarcina sp.]NLN44720.1 hypothetical protein [Methanosarcina sp.]